MPATSPSGGVERAPTAFSMTGLSSPAASITEPFLGLPQKEDRMPANEHVPISLDEVISEIATILARGYMRHRDGRRIAPDSGSGAEHVAQVEESEAFTEKRLDIPGHRSLHSFTS